MTHQPQSDFKYIAVYNWGKFQEKMKNGAVKRPYVRDAVHKDSDPDYSQLTFFQRYVLDGCRRLIGLHGHNLPNDPVWVGRALCGLPRDNAHIAHAIRTLYAHHLLLLTNERDPFAKTLNRKEEKERKEGKDLDTPPEADSSEQEGDLTW